MKLTINVNYVSMYHVLRYPVQRTVKPELLTLN